MNAHQFAKLFPMLSDAELSDMVADIKCRGLLNPIVVLNNEVLDGRNRLRACELADVKPSFVEYNGTDSLADVLSWNLHRRQLSTSQRVKVAEKLCTMKQGQRTDLEHSANLPNVAISQESASKALNVSTRAIRDAKFIKENAPEIYEKIGTKDETGKEITVNAAKQQIKEQAQQKEEKKYEEPKKEKRGKGIEIACEAIKVLRKITQDDPLRKQGGEMVTKWIADNIMEGSK